MKAIPSQADRKGTSVSPGSERRLLRYKIKSKSILFKSLLNLEEEVVTI